MFDACFIWDVCARGMFEFVDFGMVDFGGCCLLVLLMSDFRCWGLLSCWVWGCCFLFDFFVRL